MIKIPNVQMVPVDKIKTDNQNPNVMSKKQLEALKKNIQQYGFIVPIITNNKLVIADGEQRWTVAKDMGMKEVPVIALDIEDVDRRILRQVLNKLKGKHEKEGDIAEFLKILEANEMERMGELLAYDKAQMSQIMDMVREPIEVETPEIPKETDIKLGDIYQLGKHRLMCGDSTKEEDVKKLMDGKKADMVFTDPPYGTNYVKLVESYIEINKKIRGNKQKTKWKDIKGDDLKDADLEKFLDIIIKIIKNYTVNRWSCYMCFGARSTFSLFKVLDENKVFYAIPIVWSKGKMTISWMRYHPDYEMLAFFGPGSRPTGKESVWYGPNNERTTWEIKTENTAEYIHPTQKPVELITRAVKNSSKEDDVILDIFGGSGSTLIACEQLNRICYMMEIDPYYCDVIIQRWENFTGKKAVEL